MGTLQWPALTEVVIHPATDTPKSSLAGRPLALLVFFASGFGALLYQVIWQRQLVIFSGADIYSVTIIVAAFMAGLGFGSLAGGRLADRLTPRLNLRAFALAELAIGAFGFGSKGLYYDLLYTRLPYLADLPQVAAPRFSS